MIVIQIETVGPADLVHFTGDAALFVSKTAFAPGKPLDVTATIDGITSKFQLKVIGSRRRDDDRYDVRARAVNLTRDLRARLQAAFAN